MFQSREALQTRNYWLHEFNGSILIRVLKYLSALIVLSALSEKVAADELRITTPRGASVEVIADYPSGSGPFAAVILAPGQGYHMAAPLLVQTAQQFTARGIAVYRFNWAFYSKDPREGRPAPDFSTEFEDMTAVLDRVRGDTRIDRAKIIAAGKSIGSVVAWKVFSENKDLKAGLFLTPLCSRWQKEMNVFTPRVENNYPGIAEEKRPISFVFGDQDVAFCSPSILYRHAAQAGGAARVAVLAGDHSFANPALKGPEGEAAMLKNVGRAADLSADFVDTALQR